MLNMNKLTDKADSVQTLRQQAEKIALNGDSLLENLKTMSPEAIAQILHDLQVHQIELEIQNDELRRTQEELNAIRLRYFDLYDLAPVGYCTLSDKGQILEANLLAANLLGVSRTKLVGRLFYFFILNTDQDIFYLHRKKLDKTGEPQDCELRMVKPDGTPFWVHLAASTALNKDGATELRIILSDITRDKQAEAALQENKDMHRRLAEDMPMFISTFLPDGTLTYVNTALTTLVGQPSERLVGRNFYDFLSEDDAKMIKSRLAALTPEQPIETHEQWFQMPGKVAACHQWTNRAFFDAQGNAVRFQGIGKDITDEREIESKLHLAASVFTHAREGIMITTTDGSIIEVSEAFSRITGYSRDEVIGRNPRLLRSGLQGAEFYAAMWRKLLKNGHWFGELWNRRKNGENYAVMQTISTAYDAQGNNRQYVALFTDITMIKAHDLELAHMAHYDTLTRLPNRVLLADRMQQVMAQSQRYEKRMVVVFLDLDGFKTINDLHGHDVGDQLLIAVAVRMKQTLREVDTIARLGGDEFVALLVDLVEIDACIPLLKRLLAAAAEPVEIGGIVLQVSASLGVTYYPQEEDIDADQLLRQADQAMYQAKMSGKNRYHVFDAVQDHSLRGRYESLEHIRHALAGGEFVLYYQPKVNMRTGTIIGAEALIRWQHPTKGLLLPAVFLPVIEDHPLAIDIGEWVIDTTLTQLEIWQVKGMAIPVSVNIGALQLQQKDFIIRLRGLLAAHPDVSPACLKLEVLETSSINNVIKVSQVIETCREIGVLFALDDFGTGYSSLTYLKQLPVATIKLDQTFVRDMIDNLDSLSILKAVLGLSIAFNREVIAEGVETIEHGTMLLQLGCDLAQGYGIACPMPANEFPAWAAAWRPDPAWAVL